MPRRTPSGRDPGDAVPPGIPGGRRHLTPDPGDAVPPGVAPRYPAKLSEADRRAKRALEENLRPAKARTPPE